MLAVTIRFGFFTCLRFAAGPPNVFARGSWKLLRNSSRAGHLT